MGTSIFWVVDGGEHYDRNMDCPSIIRPYSSNQMKISMFYSLSHALWESTINQKRILQLKVKRCCINVCLSVFLQVAEKCEIPIPMLNIMNSGKAAAGKQNVIKELLLIPKPGITLQKVTFLSLHAFTLFTRFLFSCTEIFAGRVNMLHPGYQFTLRLDTSKQLISL